MRRRTKARRWVLQILYAWEVRAQHHSLAEEASDFFSRRRIASETRAFATELLDSIAENGKTIDRRLDAGASNWDLSRMSIVDRCILRMAVAEFLYLTDVPWKTTIDEAVELARRYGGDDSPRFVNGVLDSIAHELDLIPS